VINQVIHGQTLDQEANQQPGPEFQMTNQYQCLASYLNGGTSILDLNNFKLNGRAEEGGRRQPIAVPDYKASEPRVDSLHQKLTNLLADTSEDCNIKDIIVHGSYGDGRITYYSDIDLTVVLDEGVFDSSETIFRSKQWVLNKLCRQILEVDPLQHHGPFYLWPSLIDNYSESILPIDAYKKSWSVKGSDINFIVSESGEEQKSHNALTTMKALMNYENHFFQDGYHMYALKRMLSNLMLVPALLSQDLGKPISKAESFEWFYAEMGDAETVVRNATRIRAEWPQTPDWVNTITRLMHCLGSKKPVSKTVVRRLYYRKDVEERIVQEVIQNLPVMHDRIQKRLCQS